MVKEQMRITGDGVRNEDVAAALAVVLGSRPFRNSNQCSGLLRYIVQHTLAGEDNLLRERVIGAELFGRQPDYETSEDPVVRLRVSEVRKRLAQYYQTERDQRTVHIEIPSGSYRATFRWTNAVAGQPTVVETSAPGNEPPSELALAERSTVPATVMRTPLSQPSGPADIETVSVVTGRRRLHIAWAVSALLVLVIAGFAALVHATSAEKAYRAFWNPWLTGQKPVLISVGSNAVYRLQDDYLHRYAEEHGSKSSGLEFYVPFTKDQQLSTNDFYAAYQSFVALGDVAAVSRVVASLTAHQKPYEERFPNDISFAELRDNPSVLVGGFNNAMTLELIKKLPFEMLGGNQIVETQGAKRTWQLKGPSPEPVDYAIITRIVQREGDAPIISIAGLGQYGTLAAADLVCNPVSLELVTGRLPNGWAKQNLQVVIRVNIVDFKASASEVVASKSW